MLTDQINFWKFNNHLIINKSGKTAFHEHILVSNRFNHVFRLPRVWTTDFRLFAPVGCQLSDMIVSCCKKHGIRPLFTK